MAHIFQEANRVADYLVNKARSMDFVIGPINHLQPDFVNILMSDIVVLFLNKDDADAIWVEEDFSISDSSVPGFPKLAVLA